jgi:hypothetical protein
MTQPSSQKTRFSHQHHDGNEAPALGSTSPPLIASHNPLSFKQCFKSKRFASSDRRLKSYHFGATIVGRGGGNYRQ